MARLGGALVYGGIACAEGAVSGHQVDPDRIAILNDTHIGGHHPEDAPIPMRLKQTVSWLVGLERLPAAVIINGDLALNDGQPGDYQRFAKLVAPLREAGIPVHLTLGNHDNREVFLEVLQSEHSAAPLPFSKHVGVVHLAKAHLFLLDSLKGPHQAQGQLGPDQILWLGRMLDAHADKPAIVFGHHNPRAGGEEKYYPGGLEDSATLWELMVSRPKVKAYIHGHLHQRGYSQHRGIHIVDTPATAFVRDPDNSTTGWTMMQLAADSAEFTTLTHAKHPWNRSVKNLAWSH